MPRVLSATLMISVAGVLPCLRKFVKVLHPVGGQAVIFAARPAGTRAVLGGDQPLALEPQQQGIECALGQVGKAAVPQGGGNGIAVGRFPVNDF